MGNQQTTLSKDFEEQFREAYSFIQLLDDPNYGLVKIYRKRQLNFDYVMVYEQSLTGLTNQQRDEMLRQLEQIRNCRHEQLLRLFHYQIVGDNRFKCEGSYLRLYIEYYNFTLKNLIEFNAKTKIYLDIQEILYIINSAVAVAGFFAQLKIGWFSIAASQIVLSTTGCVYFSPVRIVKSSAQMDLCGGCTIIPTAKYDKILSMSSSARNLKHQLKRLMLDLTQHYPKHILSKFQQIFSSIEMGDSIFNINLPQSKGCAIDMMKQMYRFSANRPEESESDSLTNRKRKNIHNDSNSTSRNSVVSTPNQHISINISKNSLKPSHNNTNI